MNTMDMMGIIERTRAHTHTWAQALDLVIFILIQLEAYPDMLCYDI